MRFLMDMAPFVVFAAFAQGIFLSLILFVRAKRDRPLYWLAAFVLLVAVIILDYFLAITPWFRTFPSLLFIGGPAYALLGPTYYFFCRSITSERFWKMSDIAHAVPCVLVSIYLWPLFSLSPEIKIRIVSSVFSDYRLHIPQDQIILFAFQLCLLVVYALAAHRFLRIWENESKAQYSNAVVDHVAWIKRLNQYLAGFLAFFVTAFVALNIVDEYNRLIDLFMVLTLSAGVFAIGYRVIQKPESLSLSWVHKSRNVSMPAEQGRVIAQRLKQVMEADRCYLNPDLNLQTLATLLSISTHQLSYVLNDELGQNFYDFVNSYRVREVQKRLTGSTSRHVNVLAVALDCGFSSKSTFNRIFKKQTGLTPKDFINANQKPLMRS